MAVVAAAAAAAPSTCYDEPYPNSEYFVKGIITLNKKVDPSIKLVDGQNIDNAATIVFVKRALYGYNFGLRVGDRFATVLHENDGVIYQYMNSVEVNDVFNGTTPLPAVIAVVRSIDVPNLITPKENMFGKITPHESDVRIVRGALPDGITYQLASAPAPAPVAAPAPALPAVPASCRTSCNDNNSNNEMYLLNKCIQLFPCIKFKMKTYIFWIARQWYSYLEKVTKQKLYSKSYRLVYCL